MGQCRSKKFSPLGESSSLVKITYDKKSDTIYVKTQGANTSYSEANAYDDFVIFNWSSNPHELIGMQIISVSNVSSKYWETNYKKILRNNLWQIVFDWFIEFEKNENPI